ncbi:MAG TPA: two-component regulator propeller domain-containing protein, partial [bacterium]|nr:two-component regulator propeller domain-containing protein [bacterium]
MTINDGLSNNSINDILQTHDGYIWIATKDGLNCYDGQHFKVFKHDPIDTNTVPENYVYCLLESRDSTLWVGTWGGGQPTGCYLCFRA